MKLRLRLTYSFWLKGAVAELAQVVSSAALNLAVAHNGQLVSSATTDIGETLVLAHWNTA